MALRARLLLLPMLAFCSCKPNEDKMTADQQNSKKNVEKNNESGSDPDKTQQNKFTQSKDNAVSGPATFPSKESGKHKEFCEEEWTKKGVLDQKMADYCQQQQADGYDEVLELIKKFKDQPWLKEAIDYAIDMWTKKGTRQDLMVAYTLDQIGDGFEEMVLAEKKPGFDQSKADQCITKWRFQYDMVWFCYKQD